MLLRSWRCIAQPPLWLAVALLVAFCFFCAYGTVIVAQGRGLFPDRLAGRGVTTVNMAQCLGLAVLPAGTGYIVEAFGSGDLAYRWVFATLAGRPRAGLDRLRPRARQRLAGATSASLS